MPRKTYPHPGHSATGPAFLPGKTPRLIASVEVARIPRRVRTERYSGGSSIDVVVWTDGPTVAQVEPFIETYRDAVVVDDDGSFERVRYGADFISRKRGVSREAHAEILAWLSDEFGEPIAELKLYRASYLRERDALAHESLRDDDWRRSRESLETRPPLELQTRSAR